MPEIRVLPDILVKKIAAGEVIERPASVVKELMENAVDAGASRIGVTVEQGGTSLIRVADDGCGMSADELLLAVEPHATSKITVEDDLYRIDSLGFRGEALASVGAVSRMRIVSRPADGDEGAEIVIAAEEVQTNRAAGCPVGTGVEVRDLFFNVPARRKFLRTAGTEYGHVNTQFMRIALAHPHLAFDLKNNNRVVHQLPQHTTRRERIAKFYSEELGDALLEVRREEAGLSIEGYAAPPADARSSTSWQQTFLNGRYIRDRNIQHAIRESYRGLIDPHRHPIVFLFLNIEPEAVDVNVHPTKIEVRWRDARLVHSQILSALRETLQGADLTPTLSGDRARPDVDPEVRARMLRDFAEEFKRTPPLQPSLSLGSGGGTGLGSRAIDPAEAPAPAAGMDMWREMYRPAEEAPVPVPDDLGLREMPRSVAVLSGAIQLHNTYLVCETEEGMVIIDQHALHERILFEQFKERIAGGKLESQRLLLPETTEITQSQMALLETHAEVLDRIGLEVTQFGTDTVAIQSAPSLFKDNDVVGLLRDLLDTLEHTVTDPATEEITYAILSMMACKAAVKAGDPLTQEEIGALVSRKSLVEKSSNCPHGRPTTLRMTVKDLERQFKRT